MQKNSKLFLDYSKEKGLNTGLSYKSPIVPIIVGNSIKCLKLSQALFNRNINVYPIIHPAVSEDASRLRFFMTSEHTKEEIRLTIDTLCEILNSLSAKEAL